MAQKRSTVVLVAVAAVAAQAAAGWSAATMLASSVGAASTGAAELALPFSILLATAAAGAAALAWAFGGAGSPVTASETPKVTAGTTPKKTAPVPAEPGALALLHALQREGRLVDFLQEDLAGFDDAQIGAAARTIHEGCRRLLSDHVELERVMGHPEGDRVVVESGFDPSAVHVTGNLAGEPPYRGVLRHGGWRVRSLTLAPRPAGQDARVLAPAEVEVD